LFQRQVRATAAAHDGTQIQTLKVGVVQLGRLFFGT
jgi:hypothetical protein